METCWTQRTPATIRSGIFSLPFRYPEVNVLPTTDHEDPEGVQRYSSTLSWPRRLDGGGWSAARPGRFTPGKNPVLIVREAG